MFDAILVNPLINLLFLVYSKLPIHDLGIAVIILTVLIRLVLWPVFSISLRSQKKMQSLQKDLAKIKAKAKGDKQLESKMMMELYKEKEVNPLSSCLLQLIQIPLLIALYVVFKRSVHDFDSIWNSFYSIVQKITYLQDIHNGSLAFSTKFLGSLDLAKPAVWLGAVAGITQFIQTKMLTPKNADKLDPQAQMMKSMNYLFPALTAYIAFKLPAAMPLYWSTSNIIMIIQQWLISREEEGKLENLAKINEKGKKS